MHDDAFQRTFPLQLMEYICPVMPIARTRYLKVVLLGGMSKLRNFTFYGNGMAGNIDMYTDIIDLILKFQGPPG